MEKYTFLKLIGEYNIKIPIIQRDYAQGRPEAKNIRGEFVDALVKALTNGKPLTLDFVFGKVDGEDFQPLDGQQRLTTLFLLHWYIAHSLETEWAPKNSFTYETRTSSRDFCAALVDKNNKLGAGKTIREKIKDASWFFLSWEKDPTIASMLVMLDCIEDKIPKEKLKEIWENLTGDSPSIDFYFLDMDKFNLSDDLYIKMNARGKELTPFENFKASFQKRIEEDNWEKDKELKETFSYKIDTEWTDWFWNTCEKNEENIDSAFMRFISGVYIERLVEKGNKLQNEEKERIQELHDDPNTVDPAEFKKDDFQYLKKCFELYCDVDKKSMTLNLKRWDGEEDLFKKFTNKESGSYGDRILFYAQTQYLLKCSENFDRCKFLDWMRVVQNIQQNSGGSREEDMIRLFSLIDQIKSECQDIYMYLAESPEIESGVAKKQVAEEKDKAKLIVKSDENKSSIHAAEDTKFCKGKIEFLLYCIEFQKEGNSFNHKELSEFTKVVKDHLSGDRLKHEFTRALLSKYHGEKDGGFIKTRSSGLDGGATVFYLRTDMEPFKERFVNNESRKRYLKALLKELKTEETEKIIEDWVKGSDKNAKPEWIAAFIKDEKWLKDITQIAVAKKEKETEYRVYRVYRVYRKRITPRKNSPYEEIPVSQ